MDSSPDNSKCMISKRKYVSPTYIGKVLVERRSGSYGLSFEPANEEKEYIEWMKKNGIINSWHHEYDERFHEVLLFDGAVLCKIRDDIPLVHMNLMNSSRNHDETHVEEKEYNINLEIFTSPPDKAIPSELEIKLKQLGYVREQ